MRTVRVAAVCGLVALGPSAQRAGAQVGDEPDPCADAVGPIDQGACWTQEADTADTQMREALDALVAKLPAKGAAEARKAQKAWLEYREAHLAMLYAVENADGRHPIDRLTCAAIARRQLALARTRELQRLLRPAAADEACRL
ncbi:MAG TPA: lysozyme inhibitor LprI family protein [Vicinamibacteria bacterium]|nr:lysozyme inhibitor LprI family protein [Vicinamibacteria bacterium]